MATPPQKTQPYPLRRCYFCGRYVQVKKPDEFLLIVLENGRSFNFCISHWKKLTAVASPALVDEFRRKYLMRYEQMIDKEKSLISVSVKAILQQLDWMRKGSEIPKTR
jgi:hypothetical protein